MKCLAQGRTAGKWQSRACEASRLAPASVQNHDTRWAWHGDSTGELPFVFLGTPSLSPAPLSLYGPLEQASQSCGSQGDDPSAASLALSLPPPSSCQGLQPGIPQTVCHGSRFLRRKSS